MNCSLHLLSGTLNLKHMICVYVPCPNKKEAKRLAHALLEKRLVACANILPAMQSLYRWKGKLQRSTEVALILKTRQSLGRRLDQYLSQNHFYTCPAILQFRVTRVNVSFKEWVYDETR